MSFPSDFSAGEQLTASDMNAIKRSVVFPSLTAGEAIAGATTPVAVYIASSDNKVYACDGNDNTKVSFIGFAISTASGDGQAVNVQFQGVVAGFTGLTAGSFYYVKDDKTIGTTPGTYNIPVGQAISTTQLVIFGARPGVYVGSDSISGSPSDTSTAPTVANMAVYKFTMSNGTSTVSEMVTVYRYGATSVDVEEFIDAAGGNAWINVNVSWSGSTITIEASVGSGTPTTTGTLYFYT